MKRGNKANENGVQLAMPVKPVWKSKDKTIAFEDMDDEHLNLAIESSRKREIKYRNKATFFHDMIKLLEIESRKRSLAKKVTG